MQNGKACLTGEQAKGIAQRLRRDGKVVKRRARISRRRSGYQRRASKAEGQGQANGPAS